MQAGSTLLLLCADFEFDTKSTGNISESTYLWWINRVDQARGTGSGSRLSHESCRRGLDVDNRYQGENWYRVDTYVMRSILLFQFPF